MTGPGAAGSTPALKKELTRVHKEPDNQLLLEAHKLGIRKNGRT